jgi:hypothetical protein
MGVISVDLESLADDDLTAEGEDAVGAVSDTPRVAGHSAGKGHSRWKSAEEYREWKLLMAQLDGELDVDSDILY